LLLLVEQTREGQYDVDKEYYILASQRRLVHGQLIALTRLTTARQLYRYCVSYLLSRQTDAQLTG